MSQPRKFLACDLGAESGRALLGHLDDQRLTLEEKHRFATPNGRMNGHLHWNLLAQWEELKTGLRKTAAGGTKLDGIGVDTWGVDFGFVGRNGEVLVQLRGDGTGPHTMENSFKKAFTSRTFRIASGDMEKRLKDNPQMGAQYLTGFTTGRGALPIKIGDDVAGAAGVSGAPGGEKDEACVQTGLDKVKDQLK